ncbi:M61 family peptidase [Lacihabitans sp. LS3-19]|uniref:M61 family metallopeptidase n=1 Tax=Lacihabitans sp. LS3-19 TaxID=2487335 RepID=UPI0020CBC16A|nr:M61 family peptidase [Lacihabitans sp. LS3-19]MCP9770336.1 M61 family peptidase [Lacihabitans sp. LS3-19]
MIQYFFSFYPEKQIIDIEIRLASSNESRRKLHLPMWRPGRYQLQNFAKNVLNFSAKDDENNAISWRKTEKNVWSIYETTNKNLIIKYQYYANELNAGTSFLQKSYAYINPVNLCLYELEHINQSFEVFIKKTNDHVIFASGLKTESIGNNFKIKPKNYHHFFDSPIIISNNIFHKEFEVLKTKFHVWIQGNYQIDSDRFIQDLEKIAETQIQIFGEFPEKDFHFMLIVPENSYYHGVEHANSTMMVLGENGVLPQTYYNDLLGLASHELFHAWNIAKIRPKELLPYNYDKENYFETCFVAEGFTTYYGDKVLLSSGVLSYDQYLHELETTLRRHFEESDNASQSLLESSFDLWVDGYEKGTPNKKVSVYSKGAVVSLILDIKIRKKFREAKSLNEVMLALWNKFGDQRIGYSYQDIIDICESVYEAPLKDYFSQCIESNSSLFDYTNEHLEFLNLKMIKTGNICSLTETNVSKN